MANNDKARRIIDECIASLRAISPGGEIPRQWKSHFVRSSAAPKKVRGRKSDHERDRLLVADYLLEGSKLNPAVSGERFKSDEEPPEYGVQLKLAKKYALSQAAVSRILKKWRNEDALLSEAMQAAAWTLLQKEVETELSEEKARGLKSYLDE